jgi:hypothetical protein
MKLKSMTIFKQILIIHLMMIIYVQNHLNHFIKIIQKIKVMIIMEILIIVQYKKVANTKKYTVK